jgi:hypothetical protein
MPEYGNSAMTSTLRWAFQQTHLGECMPALIRMNAFWVVLVGTLLSNPITAVTAEPPSSPKDPVTWQPLDPANPKHAAILRWHKALIATTPTNIPPTLMISAKSYHTNPNGSEDFGVAGCMKGYFGDSREIRLVANVTPIQTNGEWKVVGSGFVPPSNNLIRVCPVK